MKHVLLILFLALSGCGPDALLAQTGFVEVGAVALNGATDIIDAARAREMAAAEEAHPTDPEHDAAIDAVAARFRPVGVALDAAHRALTSWLAEIRAARGDDSQTTIQRLLTHASTALALYEAVRVAGAAIGLDLPPAPAALLALFAPGTAASLEDLENAHYEARAWLGNTDTIADLIYHGGA